MFVRLKRLLHKVYEGIKIVICRSDLPVNPRWREEGYPYANCWDIDEFFAAASRAGPGSMLYQEARRIYWESFWRLLGRYKRGRPFFDVYVVEGSTVRPLVDREEWVLKNIISSAMAHDIVPEEAKRTTYRVYRPLFGSLTR